jgi:hypothetical protein
MSERLYTDREFALILRRATVLQAQGDEPRHALTELQDVAAQVGIPADLVARAADELPLREDNRTMMGPAASIYATALVPTTLRPARYPDLLAVIRRSVRDPGQVRELSSGLEWTRNTGYSALTVAVSSTPDGTRLRVEGEHDGNRTMIFLIPIVATGIAALIVGGEVSWTTGAIVGAGGMGTAFLAARALWSRFARRASETVHHLRDALADALKES